MESCANCKHKEIPGYCYPCCRCDAHSEYAAVEKAVEIRTNGDKYRSMSDEELAKFLDALAFSRETPWADPFARKFCDNCPTVRCVAKETGEEMELHECDFEGGECPHGDDVLWWLKQPVEEV